MHHAGLTYLLNPPPPQPTGSWPRGWYWYWTDDSVLVTSSRDIFQAAMDIGPTGVYRACYGYLGDDASIENDPHWRMRQSRGISRWEGRPLSGTQTINSNYRAIARLTYHPGGPV